MIQIEMCPWCNSEIRVSCGTRPCPKCGELIRISPDSLGSNLLRMALDSGILAKLLGR